MHSHALDNWQHRHDFALQNTVGEKRTAIVLWLTVTAMGVEIVAGSLYGSMALLADGWHMSTHAVAFIIALAAYRYARQYAASQTYTFGTGKVSVLGGFTSAVALLAVALMMVLESAQRLALPQPIHFNEAILVACVGLAVNLISAWLLGGDHDHHDHDHHHHAHDHAHPHDHNLHAAYLHVLADALTSVLAIIALVAGKYAGLHWLDAVMGIVGALIISQWAVSLLQQTAPILLDAGIDEPTQQAIQAAIERDADNQVSDLHIWKVGANQYATIISIVTHQPNTTQHYKDLLRDFHQLAHITIEINVCTQPACLAQT